ncbi:hypothetical protein [Exiguobacterium sp. s144]|uniref:hypothetical protein n=1 Tax=Exiguobacterium sp. s144 TaxID=2751195 RepID=UPI001BE89F49|nr:hypothetical protein [Exiguobacterium sp. s144]
MLETGAWIVNETAVFADRTKYGMVDDDGKLGDDETAQECRVPVFFIHDVPSYLLT